MTSPYRVSRSPEDALFFLVTVEYMVRVCNRLCCALETLGTSTGQWLPVTASGWIFMKQPQMVKLLYMCMCIDTYIYE